MPSSSGVESAERLLPIRATPYGRTTGAIKQTEWFENDDILWLHNDHLWTLPLAADSGPNEPDLFELIAFTYLIIACQTNFEPLHPVKGAHPTEACAGPISDETAADG